eukprot:m.137204 g.137204  ORF g.137204 m.137204 type:complete len:608 (+) comp9563_c0_seq4:58-1881(+)
MSFSPFVQADRAKTTAIKEAEERRRREAAEEAKRLEAEARARARTESMIQRGRSLVNVVKAIEEQAEVDAQERIRTQKMREAELEAEQRRKEEVRRLQAEAEQRRKEAVEAAACAEEKRKLDEAERVRESRRQAQVRRAMSFNDSERDADMRAKHLTEARQLQLVLDRARKDGRLPPHFNPTITWICNNIVAVRTMLYPPAEPPAPKPQPRPLKVLTRSSWAPTSQPPPAATGSTLFKPAPVAEPAPRPPPAAAVVAQAQREAPQSVKAMKATLDARGDGPLPRTILKLGGPHMGSSTDDHEESSQPSQSSSPRTASPSLSEPDDERRLKIQRMRELHGQALADAASSSQRRMTLVRTEVPAEAAIVSRGRTTYETATRAESVVDDRAWLDAQLRQEETPLEQYLGGDALRLVSDDRTIVTPDGTVRGKKNLVRSVLQLFGPNTTFASPLEERLYNEEKGKIVVYVTSVQAVRDVYEKCQRVLKIFELLRLKIQVKDIAMDSRFITELEERMPGSSVPQVFVSFINIGGAERIQELNESGQLAPMFPGFEQRSAAPCRACGGYGWMPCTWCQGSKKSIAHSFSREPGKNALRCTVCNENGLQRCEEC